MLSSDSEVIPDEEKVKDFITGELKKRPLMK